MVRTRWYPLGLESVMNGSVDWNDNAGQDIKVALMDDTFVFNDAHNFWDDVSADDYSSTGYTAGGLEIPSRATTPTDSSALTARANTTAYVKGDVRRTASDSGRCFLCVVAGTSTSSEPGGMATLGTFREIADGSVTWVNIGRGIIILGGSAVSWTGLDQGPTVGAVIYRDTGTPSTSPLLGHIDFEATETPTDLTITPPTEGYLTLSGGDVI